MRDNRKKELFAFAFAALIAQPAWALEPETEESRACWSWGNDDTSIAGAFRVLFSAPFKAVVCGTADMAAGRGVQGDSGSGFRSTRIITPSGTYRVISSPGLITVDQTAR